MKRKTQNTPLNENKVARALNKAVNGNNLPQQSGIGWLRGLLAEYPEDRVKKLCVDWLEQILVGRGKRNVPLWEINADDVGAYKARLVARKCSDATIRRDLEALGSMFEIAKVRKIVRTNVVRKIGRPPRLKNSPRRPFTEAELVRVLNFADWEWFGMILLALYTGLRLRDVSLLVYRDIELSSRFIRANVKKTKLFEPKPIPPPLLIFFKALTWPADLDQPLFPRAYALVMDGKLPILSRMFVRLLERSGVRQPGIRVRSRIREGADKFLPLSFHCLRHNHTSMLKKGNVSEAIARVIAGHLSIAVSDVYTHLGEDVTLAAVAELPEIEGVSTLY
jgi:integrase